ncbi:MAG TPA: hypothetical protein VLL25_05210 [Acidimicrobiales bacterium]|nr:hypothetical protein [Acidimicrobiales bacterium]
MTEEFVPIATQIANLNSHPNLRQLVLPYPLEGLPDEEVRTIANDAYPHLKKVLGVTT